MKKLLLLLLLIPTLAYGQTIETATKVDILSTSKVTLGTDEVSFMPSKLVSVDTSGAEVKTYIEPAIQFTKSDKTTLTLSMPSTDGYTDKTITDGVVKISNMDNDFYFKKYDETMVKFGVILNSQPKSNRWEFTISGAEDLEFVRPASIFKDGVAQHIPEQLGGYKINRISTGEKFGFFYQPIFKDAKGNTCLAKLLIEDNKYTITVNPDWLAKASYPVIANDSFSSVYDGSTRAITVSVSQNNLIVVGYSYIGADLGATISDENSNSYTQLGTGIRDNQTCLQVWWALANTTNSTCTITCSSKTDPGLSCHVYTNVDTSDPYDNHLTYTDSSSTTNHSTGNLAVSTNAGILFAYWANEDAANSGTHGTGWEERTEELNHYHRTDDRTFSASGNYTASFTSTGSQKFVCIFAAFNTPSGGGATRQRLIMVN